MVLSVALKIDMHQLYNLKVVFKKGGSFSTSNDHNALLTPSPEVTYPYDVGLKSSKWSCTRKAMASYLVSTKSVLTFICIMSKNTQRALRGWSPLRGYNYSRKCIIIFVKDKYDDK